MYACWELTVWMIGIELVLQFYVPATDWSPPKTKHTTICYLDKTTTNLIVLCCYNCISLCVCVCRFFIIFDSIFIYGARSLGKMSVYDLVKQTCNFVVCHGKMEMHALSVWFYWMAYSNNNEEKKQILNKTNEKRSLAVDFSICHQFTCAHVNLRTRFHRYSTCDGNITIVEERKKAKQPTIFRAIMGWCTHGL